MSRTAALALVALATLSACETTPSSQAAPAVDPGADSRTEDVVPVDEASATAVARVALPDLELVPGCEPTATTMTGTIDGQDVQLSLWDADNQLIGDIVGDAFLASDTDDLYILGDLLDASGAVVDQVDGKATPDGRIELDSRTLPEAEVFYGSWREQADGTLSVAGDHAVCADQDPDR